MNISRQQLGRIVVAVDPATTASEDSDDTGIIAVAKGPHQPETCTLDMCPGHAYVLKDATCHLPPPGVARQIIAVYDELQADRVVAETNNGGDYIGAMIHAIRADIPYSKVTASRGKQTRAEPAAALYEQGRVHHCGVFPELEQEQETWTQDASWSPNRLDALVWACADLGLIGAQGAAFLAAWAKETDQRRATPYGVQPMPALAAEDVGSALRAGCQHRFMPAANDMLRCVHCGGERAAE